jgi:hypothetical protein
MGRRVPFCGKGEQSDTFLAACPLSRAIFVIDKILCSHKIESLALIAEVAQLVEHTAENRGVPSPILGLGTCR